MHEFVMYFLVLFSVVIVYRLVILFLGTLSISAKREVTSLKLELEA